MPRNWSILVLALAYMPTYSSAGPSLGFSVSLHQPTSPVRAGTELRLTTTIANISDHEVRFAKSLGAPDEALTYETEIRDASGQEPPITPYFRELKDSNYGWHSVTTYFLEPGKTFDESLVVTKLHT